MPLLANSRMYNISPQVEAAWDSLFTHIATKTGVELHILRHAFPDSIEALWAKPNLGVVLMCGYPYAQTNPRPHLLAAPIPTPSHYQNRSIYFTHLLVDENAPFQTVEDTFGHRISWTIKNSQSGFNAVRSFLLPYWLERKAPLYKQVIGPIGTFTVGVEGIRNNEIDVVPIDSFSYDLMVQYAPEKVAGTRIIATTPPSPFPPLVAGYDIDTKVVAQLQDALIHAHLEPELHPVLATIMLDRFDHTTPHYYNTMLQQAAYAQAKGYEMIA